MFPDIFEVLKIPARSTLFIAGSQITTIAATSATLAARRFSEGGFGSCGRYLGGLLRLLSVEISFRAKRCAKNVQNLWERACSRRRRASRLLHQLTDRFREQARTLSRRRPVRRQPSRPATRCWSSSPASAPSSGKRQSTPGSLRQGTPARHPAPAAMRG